MTAELGLQPYLGRDGDAGGAGSADARASEGSSDAESGGARPTVAVFRTSILQGTGFVEAMQWLASELPT